MTKVEKHCKGIGKGGSKNKQGVDQTLARVHPFGLAVTAPMNWPGKGTEIRVV